MTLTVGLLTVAVVVTMAWLLPELWARLRLRRAWTTGGATRRVALTFDDGPDPETTPLVLEVLRELGAPATFFVVGERAAEHAGLVRTLRDRGHEVAAHGYCHRHHWARTLWGIRADLARSRELLAGLFGKPPRFYRPPWGMVSSATLLAMRGSGLDLALYDVESGDWLKRGPQDIADRVLRRTQPGSVVLLHDAARDPQQVVQMVQALRQIIRALRQRGYEFVTLSELRAP